MNFLVPIDGSPASLRALKHALTQIRSPASDTIVLVNVQNPAVAGLTDGAGVMPPAWIEQEEARIGREIAEEPRRLCEEAGVPCKVLVEFGVIASAIERVTKAMHIDQIFMGTRGLGAVQGLVMGSVATQVLHIVSVPVTFVK